MRNFRIAPYNFQQQYVAAPIEFLQNQLDKRQQAYDRNVFTYNENLGKLAEEAAYDPIAKAEYLKRVSGDYDQVYEKYRGDMAAATPDVLGVINKARADEYRNINAAALEKQKQFEQVAIPLRAQGKALEFKGMPTSLMTTDENGRPRYLRREELDFDVEGKLGWQDKMMDIWNYALHPESYSTQTDLAGADMSKIQGKTVIELKDILTNGISQRQINRKQAQALLMYMNTPEYTQQKKTLTQLNGMSPAEAEELIATEVLKTGEAKKWQDYQDKTKLVPVGTGRSSGGSGEPDYLYQRPQHIPVNQSTGLQNKYESVSSLLGNLTGEYSNLTREGFRKAASNLPYGTGPGTPSSTKDIVTYKDVPEFKSLKQEYSDIYNRIAKNAGPVPNKEIDRQFLSYMEQKLRSEREKEIVTDFYAPSQYRSEDLAAAIFNRMNQGDALYMLDEKGEITDRVSKSVLMEKDKTKSPLVRAGVAINFNQNRIEFVGTDGNNYAVPRDKLPLELQNAFDVSETVREGIHKEARRIIPKINTGTASQGKSYYTQGNRQSPIQIPDGRGGAVALYNTIPVLELGDDGYYYTVYHKVGSNGKLEPELWPGTHKRIAIPYDGSLGESLITGEFQRAYAENPSKGDLNSMSGREDLPQ